MKAAVVAELGPRRGVGLLTTARADERSVQRRVALAWGLLFLNALTYYGSILHVPSAAGKLIQQGALPAALIVALSVNRRMVIRPNLFLFLATLLALEAILPCLQPQHLGTLYRTLRLEEFVAGLWLLSPWWGRRDMLLVRSHLVCLALVQGTVILGLLVAPGHALAGHRLGGVLWAVPATEVGHYAAITAGAAIVLWLGGLLPGRLVLGIVVIEGIILVLTHTRTALFALVLALMVAGLSMIVDRVRVRRFFLIASVIVIVVVALGAGFLATWLERGQSAQELTSLTGRTDFWNLVLNLPRTRFQDIFGFGLSNGSVDGLPIDSNWLVAYLQQGIAGVVIAAAMLLYVLVAAFFQPSGTRRALALFLAIYCLVASLTQVGFATASVYLLELTLAASLLVPLPAERQSEL
jgi:hypothetical protein